MKKLVVYFGLMLLLGACSDANNEPSSLTGPSVRMGNGKANAWLKLDAQGQAAAVGFTLSKGALEQLPTTAAAGEFMLALPDAALEKTPFQHVMINWNPTGHEPRGIYDVPHFDMHFYLVPMNEVMAIPPYAVNPGPFDRNPPAAFLPVGFVKNPGGVPAMGAHWSDVASPEFKGQPFTETFVYGSYDGRVTFWEQMAALSYLVSGPSFDKPIAQPAQYEVPGYYPTRYSMKTQPDGSLEVALSGFMKR